MVEDRQSPSATTVIRHGGIQTTDPLTDKLAIFSQLKPTLDNDGCDNREFRALALPLTTLIIPVKLDKFNCSPFRISFFFCIFMD